MFTNKVRVNIPVIIILVFFFLVYASVSLVNHFLFRTYALDLGMYNHALYAFAHFQNAHFTLGIDGVEMPFLGTHFSLIIILISPLYYIFGNITLLLVQIFAILFGGFGIYKLAKEKNIGNSNFIPLVLTIYFFSIWGIYSALSFDFHCNVIGAMFVVWFIYFMEKRELKYATLFFILALFSTETFSIWLFFIIIGLALKNWKLHKSSYLKYDVPLAIFSLLYGVVVIFILMPYLQGFENNLQFTRYAHLGNSIKELFANLTLIFQNTTNDSLYDGIKGEFLIMVLVSGGIALLLRPIYLFMLIPILAQKLLSNDYAMWGINYHYSIEFAPILGVAVVDTVSKLKKRKLIVVAILTLFTIFSTIYTLEDRKSLWYSKRNSKFYSPIHYHTNYSYFEVKKALNLVPDSAIVSSSSCLAPHLSFRKKIYHFPIVKDSHYIVLARSDKESYPLSKDEFVLKLNELKNSMDFVNFFEDDNLIIFQKRNSNEEE